MIIGISILFANGKSLVNRANTTTELHVESNKIFIDRSHRNGRNRMVYYPMETWD